jgi:hypothetical protein
MKHIDITITSLEERNALLDFIGADYPNGTPEPRKLVANIKVMGRTDGKEASAFIRITKIDPEQSI